MVNTQRIPPEFEIIRQTRGYRLSLKITDKQDDREQKDTQPHPRWRSASRGCWRHSRRAHSAAPPGRRSGSPKTQPSWFFIILQGGCLSCLHNNLFPSIQISSRNSKHLVGLFQEEHDDPEATGEKDQEAKGREGRLLEELEVRKTIVCPCPESHWT